MQTLRRSLFFSLTLQVCLAAAIFAAAEEAPLALFTLPVAVISLVVIDLLGWVSPNPILVNLVGLAALGLAFVEFRVGGESRLLAGGHLLVYLTWTFLMQVKDLRRMWWLFALSVLQVAVAAVLTSQPWFGAALFVYTSSAVWTMSLLSLTRAALLADPQLLSFERLEVPLEQVTSEPFERRNLAINGVRTDEQGRWISPRILGGGVVTLVLTLVVGLTFFVLTPRVWIGSLNSPTDSAFRKKNGKATGFVENVKLGDIGQIMESHDLALTVTVFDGVSGQRVPVTKLADAVGEEPAFRGTVLESYAEGSWSKHEMGGWQESFDAPGPVRLLITAQPIGSPTLFYTGTAVAAKGLTEPDLLYYHPFTLALETNQADQDAPYTYSVTTSPPDFISDQSRRLLTKHAIRMNGFPRGMRRLLSTPTPRLTQLAHDVLDRSDADGDPDSEATARVLESYLRDSGQFEYTLDLAVTDPTIDPVEDFVFNRKKGHCEYFASTLALMLRGVGIPTRLISGFKGADYNEQTGNLEVRALHAHAWVEAFVDGGWLTFDPTPADRDAAVAAKVKDSPQTLADQTRSFWFQSMNYSKAQQAELVYTPLIAFGSFLKSNFAGLMNGNLPLLAQLRAMMASPRGWFTGVGGAVTLFLLLTLAGVIWMGRKLVQRWKGWTQARDLAQRRAITVEFYARLMQLLQRFGLTEIQTQTPREFAHRAEDQLRSRLEPAGLSGTTLRLVEMFYAVRFGNQPLTADQLQSVDQLLGQLERRLAQPVT